MIAPESKHRDGQAAKSLPPQSGFPPQACGGAGPGGSSYAAMGPTAMGRDPLGHETWGGETRGGGGFAASVPPQLSVAVSAARSAIGGAGGRLPLPVLVATAAVLGITAGWLIKRR
ncbi:hypothetical protein [Candidatus Laterigemmans baculatus]|uniref:hypothetical protein n=1 Tax=Candidatus Laterigemmans baculatus TaxID=2770505 RepID=UPI0013D9F4E4|nr:hypothetical protein [Candidatus Laterigemmans baculatus]